MPRLPLQPKRSRRSPIPSHKLLRLRLSPSVDRIWVEDILQGLPQLLGSPITLSIQPELTSHRGGLLSGQPLRGTAVYAASFIRERRIVLEDKLLRQKRMFRLILVHELFHFVWARLGNEKRSEFSRLLAAERKARARGELGESAQVRKDLLKVADCWRDYVCEGFCDTAAWFYAGVRKHESFTLAKRWQVRRAAWFSSRLSDTLSS